MKALTYSLFAAAAACCFASAQTTAYTTPVGYVTETLAPGQFNLISLTLHNSTASAGVLTAADATSVTAGTTDFVALLGTPGAENTHILELADGTIQEITSWTAAGVLTTPEDISSKVTAGTTTYTLRKADTIASVFGATNSAGLTPSADGDTTNADTIQIFNGSGFDVVYYFNDGAGTEGWFDEGGNSAANKPIIYADGIYVKRAPGAPIDLVVSGEVKTVATSGALIPGYNYLGAVAPVGLTLATSGLKNFISQSADGDTSLVDTVQIQVGAGYQVFYYFNDGAGTEGWYDEGGNAADTQPLDGGFLIFNRGGVKPYTVSVPASYGSL